MPFAPSAFQFQFLRGAARFQQWPAVPVEPLTDEGRAALVHDDPVLGRVSLGIPMLSFANPPGVPLPFIVAELAPPGPGNPTFGREKQDLVLRGLVEEHEAIIDRDRLENDLRRLPIRYRTLDGREVVVALEEQRNSALVEARLLLTVGGRVIEAASPFDHVFPHYLVTPAGFALLDEPVHLKPPDAGQLKIECAARVVSFRGVEIPFKPATDYDLFVYLHDRPGRRASYRDLLVRMKPDETNTTIESYEDAPTEVKNAMYRIRKAMKAGACPWTVDCERDAKAYRLAPPA